MGRVLVTRPKRDADRWVLDLSARGFNAIALPLIEVGPVEHPDELVRVWQQLAGYTAVMFVSGNAVEHFFALKPALALAFIGESTIKTRAWATGPGTSNALLRAGVAPEWLDAPPPDADQFDSEGLWRVVQSQVRPGDRVLIVRGADSASGGSAGQGLGREWFANRLAGAGAVAEFAVSYQRRAPIFSDQEQALARRAATDGSVWLFSSSEAVANLTARLPGQTWGSARALATHPRIAAAVKEAGFGVVGESRPTLTDVAASLTRVGLAPDGDPG